MNVNKKTPNRIIEQMMQSWSMETLSDISYTRTNNKWRGYKKRRRIEVNYEKETAARMET